MPDDSSKDGSAPSTSEPVSATPPPVPSDGAQALAAAKPADPLVGKVLLDRVRIIRPIARGGMGKVYFGEQTRMKRSCAIKVLSPRFTGGADAAEFARLFLLEASIAAKLNHPHVVTIFDYGESPDGCFIAMEYLSGRSLSEELSKGGRLVAERAIHIAKQVARALREAHALGVVHRDIKPGNIFLLKQDDDDDFVKVLDFGLVHDSKATDARDQPSPDAILGSPRYMAPEQVQGKEIDARTDIYSLGGVLYAMLTGHPPFERRTDLATMMAQVSDPPLPMASVAPGIALPPGLEAVVMRCLAKSPDQRFASMEELVAALALRSGEAAEPDPATTAAAMAAAPPVRPQRAHARRPASGVGKTLGVAAIFAVIAALVGVALLDRPTPVAPPPAAAPVTAAPPPPVVVAPPKATATLHVETDPPGAKVNEEGETMCPSTPCNIVYSGHAADPSVEHMLAFLLPGYRLERKVTTATGSPVTVKLTKAH
ncbi:MAG TPA: serine/threonine-protein kinase [Polyangiaceae bacterium]|nr:serine/threonine-protein kinase [Polyangiaceae bacterium]